MKNISKEKKDFISVIAKWLIFASLTVLLGMFVFGVTIVNNNDMYPRVSEGDMVFYYRLNTTNNVGDVVVYETDKGTQLGRVVALAGDRVEFSGDGRLIIDDCVQSVDAFYYTGEIEDSNIRFPYDVPDNTVFVLSDYRTEALNDSRVLGAIEEDCIMGRVMASVRRRDF